MSDDAPRPGSEVAVVVRRWVRLSVLALLLLVLVAVTRLGGFPWVETLGVALTAAALWLGQSFVFRALARGRLARRPVAPRGGEGGPNRPG
ncbi:hypothetical protein GCM10009416_49100 [Craurococcus roseus]|uniref:Uncharacterized protein n=1 Tax=Craurococcus roseus TaxID=77585 RepID=A0ABN1G827_9PROT